jgi:hypothetical protein
MQIVRMSIRVVSVVLATSSDDRARDQRGGRVRRCNAIVTSQAYPRLFAGSTPLYGARASTMLVYWPLMAL